MAADSPLPDPLTESGANVQRAAAEPEGDTSQDGSAEKQFHGWRLLGVLFLVIVATAVVSAVVDLAVIPR